MNHVYKIIWNTTLGTWIVASELAKHAKKHGSLRFTTLMLPLLLNSTMSLALPNGNELVAGSVEVATPAAGQMQINQSSQNAIVNWQDFSIGANETVNIQQPNVDAALLNRVVGQDASTIQGQLNANGQVYLVNPNGVLFSKTAQVDVGGLVASTHAISNQDFLNGNQHFTQDGANGAVINQGEIKTPKGGVVALIGEQVENSGSINTPEGSTVLAAGKSIDLDMQGDGLVEVKVTEAALKAQINNHGIIQADGGQVVMTAQAAGQLLNTVINNDGVIEARGLVEKDGKIVLAGGNVGVVEVGGIVDVSTLDNGDDASGSKNSGAVSGSISISGAQIGIKESAHLNADSTQTGKQGSIQLVAEQDITLNAGSKISANSTQGDAGIVQIDSETGTTLAQGTIEAKAIRGGYVAPNSSRKGGRIELLGERVGVTGNATIDASGESGGGQVLIGGDYQGTNPAVHNAKATYAGKDASINADANTYGDGGKVIVWSNEVTRAYGNISAKGGSQSGKGGFIETSGHWLDTTNIKIDTSAAHDKSGDWLLDPWNVTIRNNGESGDQGGTFSSNTWLPNATGSIITPSTIKYALEHGTSVTITTTGAGGEDGNIIVEANINKGVGGDATLILRADNDIAVSSSISSVSNKLNVILNADADGNRAGNIIIKGGSINTLGGNIILGGGANPLDTSAFGRYKNAGISIEFSTLNAGAGNINARGSNISTENDYGLGINIVSSGLETTTGSIKLYGTGGDGIDNNSGITLSSSSLFSNSGAITLDGNGGAGGDFNYGVLISGSLPENFSIDTTGLLNISGTSGGTGDENEGIGLASASLSAGVISLTGTGGRGMSNNRGINAWSEGAVLGDMSVLKSAGDMMLIGNGGGVGSGVANNGIELNSVTLHSDHGTVVLNGTAGAGDHDNIGVLIGVDNTSYAESSLTTNGTISITGRGGSGTGSNNAGIGLSSASMSAAEMSLTGRGGTGSDLNRGIVIEAYSAELGGSVLASQTDIDLVGIAGEAVTGANNDGIALSSARILSSIGNITLTGTGGAGTDNNYGINSRDSIVSSKAGYVDISGTGGAGSSFFNAGVLIDGGSISTDSSSPININGTGGGPVQGNYGILLGGGTAGLTFSAASGAISLDGVASGDSQGIRIFGFGQPVEILATGSAPISFQGNGSGSNSNSSIFLDGSSGAITIGGASASGDISFVAGGVLQDIAIGTGVNIQSTGGLILRPLNANTSIGVSGGAGTFNLASSELSSFVNGFSGITIGNQSGTGVVNINGWNVPGSADLTVFGGDISQAGPLTVGAGRELDLVSLNSYTNGYGPNALAGGGRWLVYAASPSSVIKNGLTSNFRQYNTVYGDTINSAGNGFIYASTFGELNIDTVLLSGDAFNTYGTTPTAVFGYTASASSEVDGEDLAAISGEAIFTPTITNLTDVGEYTISYSDGLSSTAGHTLITGTGVIYTVNPAALTITANADHKFYDGQAHFGGNGVIYSPFVNSETEAVLGGSLKYGGDSQGAINAGTYTITPSGLTSSNYAIRYIDGQLTVGQAPLSVTANQDDKTYDGLPYLGGNGVEYNGFVHNETESVLGGILTYGGDSQGAINPDTYEIIPGGLTSDNYAISFISGSLFIFDRPEQIDPVDVPTKNEPSTTQDNTAPLSNEVLYSTPVSTDQYVPGSGSIEVTKSVSDETSEFAGITPQYCDSSAVAVKTADCQKPLENYRVVLPTLKVKNSAGGVKRLQMSTNNRYLSLLLEDGSVRVWDFQQGDQHRIVSQKDQPAVTDIGPVDNKGELVSIASTAGIATQDVILPTLEKTVNIRQSDINQFVTSNDGGLVLVSTEAGQLSLWNSRQNKKLWHVPYDRGVVKDLALSESSRFGAVLSRQPGAYVLPTDLKLKSLTDAVNIIDLGTGSVVKSLPNLGEQILAIHFVNNDTLQLRLANGELLNWSVSGESPDKAGNFAEPVAMVDSETKSFAYVNQSGEARIGDGQGHVLLSLENKENPFKDALLLDEDKKLLTVMANGELVLWDVGSGKKMLRLFSTKQGWTVMDAYGRFDGSEDAMENFSWSADQEDIPLDSFSENYYEPGLLSSVLQDQDYLNRNPNMVKSGITLPPKVVLQLADQQAQGDHVSLRLDVFDRGGGIDQIEVYQNGKILGRDSTVVDQQTLQEPGGEHRILTLNVTPTAGKNIVKVVASNHMGIENGDSEISFDGKTKAYASSLRLLTIGIDQYSDNKLNLEYSVKDATAIAEAIGNSAKVAVSKAIHNKDATKSKILAELKELSQGVQQDVLVIYFAGHGVALDKEWYFLPHEAQMRSSLEEIAATGITATELSDIFKSSKIQHILLMVDSCYSGAGMDAFSKLQNGQRYFTRQLSRSLGITVMTAAAKDQQAYELQSLGHGLFTYLVTQELEGKDANKPVTAHGIAESIANNLPIFSKKVLGTRQEPAVYAKGNDFMLTNLVKKPVKGEEAGLTRSEK